MNQNDGAFAELDALTVAFCVVVGIVIGGLGWRFVVALVGTLAGR